MRFRLGLTVLLAAALCQLHAAEPVFTQELPFKYQEGLIWLPIRVPQSAEPLNFLLDSGASVSVINLHTAQKLGLKLGKQVSVEGVRATAPGYWPQHLSANLGELPLPRDYLAVDLTALGGSCQCRLDGLLGADFFHNRVVQIDFGAQKIRLLRSSNVAERTETIPIKMRHGAFRVPVRVNGGDPQWLRLDTGCASSLHWVNDRVRVTGCAAHLAVALTKFSVPYIETSVQIGANFFNSVPSGLHEKPIFSGESGLLGNGLLSRFDSIIVDAKAGRLILQKRTDDSLVKD